MSKNRVQNCVCLETYEISVNPLLFASSNFTIEDRCESTRALVRAVLFALVALTAISSSTPKASKSLVELVTVSARSCRRSASASKINKAWEMLLAPNGIKREVPCPMGLSSHFGV
eukprot:Blabericola_migrator_1__8738@NODE_45_length_16846_cov_82_345015_g41_i0_p17_GENE_NODE_45_length_16846_cov_82_345015_g41_i0NODE_45_length_16846_cov_82_345015_g41_i0_p17_ORF_typecomplete_len116_score17_81TPPK_C/PF12555_8/0_041_NODE_45_length_16846_cov_82_345015_g41_i01075011097